MNTSAEESKAVRLAMRELGDKLADLGFAPSRSTFFTRVRGDFVEFFHVHKYRGASEFRVHCGARALDDATPHPVLNGPDSDSVVTHFPNPLVPRRRYRFNFNASPESIRACVESMFDFCRRTGERWFAKWRKEHPPVGRRLLTETADLFKLADDEVPD
jgi:hypothetical protein